MKTIKIAHLYYDIMNLYGENANVRFLKKKLEDQGIKVEVYFLSLEDKFELNNYDFIYIGSGTENDEELVRENILQYKDDFKEIIDKGTYVLVTGNAFELMGKEIQYLDGSIKPCLNISEFITKEEEFRTMEDEYYYCSLIDKKILGFQNHAHVIEDERANLFSVIKGSGYNPSTIIEGIHKNNFFGTYLIGPLLVRNPYLTDYIVKNICKNNDVTYKEPNKKESCYLAYNQFIKNFYENQEN